MKVLTLLRIVLLLGIAVSLCCPWPVAAQEEAQAEKEVLAADLVEDGQAIDTTSERYVGLFKELRLSHGFSEEELAALFSGVAILKRPLELMDKQWEAKPYYEYYPRLINDEMVRNGRRMLEQHAKLLDRVEEQFKVERQVLVAIWGVETKFGKHIGDYPTFQTLNTLFDAYPRRRNFFRKQLIQFLVLCKENGIDPHSINGSYAGAIGQTQFIPSSFREYAVDFDGDGRRDVWNSVDDVLASIANYLHRYRWEFGSPIYWDLGTELKDHSLMAAFRQGRSWYVPWEHIKKVQGVELPPESQNKKIAIVGLELPEDNTRFVAAFPNLYVITKWNNSSRYAMVIAELAERLDGRPAR